MFSWFQNSLLVSPRGLCWWAPFGWFPRHRGGLSSTACRWCLPSPAGRAANWPSASGLACLWPVVCVASVSCRRQHKAFSGPAFFIVHSKIVKAGVRHKSHRWKLDADAMGGKIKMRPKDWVLLSWHWSVNSISDEKFCHYQLGAHFFLSSFSGKTLTKYLPPYLPCPGNNRFESGIERALGPSRLVWSSDSSYPWNDRGCYGL